ncbi:DsrE family protein [Pontimicrobium sp. SW4]|uniref:DsrE family protein n=1 Tax=Pontimicrobium sp. SW4 TaxID=3153519 RepID=A0AAU7BPV2_9FLAO
MKKFLFTLYLFTLTCFSLLSQNERLEGKIIKNFGETFTIETLDIKTDISKEFKVIFDVSQSSTDRSIINKNIVTAARFLNMHANEGMKKEQLKVAMTIHGGAWQDVLNNKAYKEKYGVDNPNLELINELTKAGADIIICGQTASFRGITKDNANPNVKFALSAMTALIQYQNNGYTFIKF